MSKICEVLAEIKTVNTKFLVSGDKSHRITIDSIDPEIIKLGAIPPQTMVKVRFELCREEDLRNR